MKELEIQARVLKNISFKIGNEVAIFKFGCRWTNETTTTSLKPRKSRFN